MKEQFEKQQESVALAIKAIVDVSTTVENALEDRKISKFEAFKILAAPFPEVIQMGGDFFDDLRVVVKNQRLRQEVVDKFAKEFDLKNDHAELVAEKALEWLDSSYELYSVIKTAAED